MHHHSGCNTVVVMVSHPPVMASASVAASAVLRLRRNPSSAASRGADLDPEPWCASRACCSAATAKATGCLGSPKRECVAVLDSNQGLGSRV